MRFPVFCETSSPAARLVVLLSCLLLATSAPAATYYVSNAGSSDSYAGSEAQPFATLTKALSASGWGDTVLLARGSTFRIGGLDLGSSRTFRAYGTAALPNPVIAGSGVITGWAPSAAGSSIFVASVPAGITGIKQVYVDGRRMTLARTPSIGWLRTDEGSSDNTIIDTALPKPPTGNWVGAQVRWRKWTWIYETRPITSDNGAGTLTIGGTNTLAGLTGIGSGYFIDNTLKALDYPGEWFYDATTAKLYLYPPAGTNPAAMQVEAAWRPKGANITGATLEDLTVRHFTEVGLEINNRSTLRRCTVEQMGGAAINTTWDCGGTLITGCTVRDVLDNATTWIENPNGPGGSLIEHCTFERIGSVPGLMGNGPWHGVGIIVHASKGLQIRLNQITETGYAGIIPNNAGLIITRNVFRRCMATLNDGGAIYCNTNGTRITENIILDTVGDLESSHPWTPLGHGIWPEFLSKFHDQEITNNTIYGSGGSGIWLPNHYNCNVSGNVLVSNRLAALSLGGYENEYATPADAQQNHTLANNTLAIGARSWQPFPGQVQTLASWAAQNDYLLDYATFTDRDLDYGTMSGTKMLTRDGLELVRRNPPPNQSPALWYTPAQWLAAESAWADPAPTTDQGNGYLFINDTETTVAFPLPAGVTWQQLGGAAVGSTISIAPFRSVVLLASAGDVAGVPPYSLASGISAPLNFAEWLLSYGLPPPGGQTAADSDGDGLPDMLEYVAGPLARRPRCRATPANQPSGRRRPRAHLPPAHRPLRRHPTA
jgi:parallel beta-helix repeat protein